MRAFPLRRSFLFAALLGTALFTLSCGGDSGSPSPTPTNVVVTPGADTLVSVGETKTFTASVLDANGDPIDGRTVTWSSTAPAVLTIDPATGVATAVANGLAQVHATAGALQGSANVVVVQIVASVTVTPGNVAFTAVGDTARFTAVAKDAGNTPVVGVQILWSVSDNTVATIDTLGLAKSKGPGTALVSAQAQTRAGYAALGVAPAVTHIAILAHPDSGIAGDPITAALQVELRDANGHRVMDASLPVVVSAAGAATGTPLHGTTTLISDQGRANFAGLWLERAGADRLKVTVGGVPPDTSATLSIRPGDPALVHASVDSTAVTAGNPVGLRATFQDRFANPITTFDGQVQVMLVGGADFGTVVGDTLIDASAGIADFANVQFQVAGGPYRLTATLPGVTIGRDTTPAITVHHAAPMLIHIVALGGIQAPRGHFGDSTFIEIRDVYENPVADTSIQVQVGVVGWPYTSPPAYAEQATPPGSFTYTAGQGAVALGVTRPGRVRIILSFPGGIPDTLDEAVAHLPQAIIGQYAVTDLTSCVWSVFCAGSNAYGLLGVDSTLVSEDSLFVLRDGGGNPVFVDGGARHICSTLDAGGGGSQIACWGDNSDGQLGGGTVGGASPTYVLGVSYSVFQDLSAGGSHSCAIGDGVTHCWGKNDEGELGTGSAGASTGTPSLVTGGHIFAQISAGGRHTCAIDKNAHLWCWGANDLGQLGDSGVSGAFSAIPVEVDSTLTWAHVAAGSDFTCAIRDVPAQLFCWGNNDRQQLAGAPDSLSRIPIEVMSGGFAALVVAGDGFACASGQFPSDPETRCWGANDHGQLGRGTVSPFEATPLPLAAGGQMTSMAAGASHVCAKNPEISQQLICWGRNDHGQLGSGNTTDVPFPFVVDDQY